MEDRPRNRLELQEAGRKLASEREDLIAAGVDSAELLIPLHPGEERRQMNEEPVLADRLAMYREEWGWHEADGERRAGPGYHMGQMLARLPRDGQTDDMEASIGAMLADLEHLRALQLELVGQLSEVITALAYARCGHDMHMTNDVCWLARARRAASGLESPERG